MKLNLRLVMESLEPTYESVFGNPDRALNLTCAYPFVPGRGPGAPDALYVAQWENLMDAESLPKNLVCIGGGEASRKLFEDRGVTGLGFPEGCDAMALLLRIQEIFSKYNGLERRLLDALLAKAPMRSVLNACSMFLECHTALYGVDFRLLEYSDAFPPPEDDPLWKKTLSERRSVVPMIPREKVRMLPNRPSDFPRSSFIDVEGLPRHINVAFDCGDARVATMIFSEVSRPISPHHMWLADYIADIIQPAVVERYNTHLDTRAYFRNSVAAALRYLNSDPAFLLANIKRFGWSASDDYQLLVIELPPENSEPSYYLYNYENLFAEGYSDAIALRHDDYILIILHGGACSLLEKCLPTLRKQLDLDGALCGVSLKFCDFTLLKVQYELARLALHLAPKGGRIRFYREILEPQVVGELRSRLPLRAMCHYAAVRLREYDAENGTDFLLTLETYLKNNRSLIAAANRLFIHRSTLAYRLRCIEKIASMDLEDPGERLHILLSCIALRALAGDPTP